MVVFLDLDNEALEPAEDPRQGPFSSSRLYPANNRIRSVDRDGNLQRLQSPGSAAGGFAAALACYPVVIQLARSLDLNTLHSLSRVCHQFRTNLLQFRRQIITRTLRCAMEVEASNDGNGTYSPRYRSWDVVGSSVILSGRITSTKIGPCARDMVSDCHRCGKIVCRNCITKPSSAVALPHRLRRLCSVCTRAPLSALTGMEYSADEAFFTSAAFAKSPCTCKEVAYICQPCGHVTSNADINYRRIWDWRTRYSTYLGGLGTGIAEGNEGVKCARGERCVAAQDIEVEIDCTSQENMSGIPIETVDRANGTPNPDTVGKDDEKAGYLRQEIDGVGGVVRKKFRKRMRVGKAVEEFEHEREKGEFMAREVRGDSRSWCGWCNRVVPGHKDLHILEH